MKHYLRRPKSSSGLPPISGLLLDIDPSKSVYQDDGGTTPATADGDVVGRIVDHAGSNAFIQATVGKKPTLHLGADGMNSKPVLRFAGAQLLRAGNVLASGQAGTIFVVCKPNVLQEGYLLSSCDEATTNYRWVFSGCVGAATPKFEIMQTNNDGYDRFRSAVNMVSGTPYITTLRSDTHEYQMRVNGAMQLLVTGSGTNTGDWFSDTSNRDNLVIGCIKHTSEAYFYSGDIARILVYDSSLSSSDILRVEGYLSRQYGITVSTEKTEYSKVLITFDDTHGSVYDIGYTYAATKSIKGTFFVNSGLVEATGDDVTWAELGTMNTGGWDIGNHGKTHAALTDPLTQGEMETEIGDCRDALDSHGLTRASKHLSYPGGAYNATTLLAMAAQAMLTGRRADGTGPFNPDSPPPIYEIPHRTTAGQNWLAAGSISDHITSTNYYNKVIIYLFHRIAPVTAYLTVATAEWQAFVDWLSTHQFPVLTVSEMYDQVW